MKAVILCGGGGTRLWPMSREQSPKQFQRLVSNHSLLQDTVRRVAKVIPKENIYLSTNEKFVPEIQFQLFDLPRENIIVEPAKMDNSAAIGLSLLHVIHGQKESEPVVFLPADHVFKNENGFLQVLQQVKDFCTLHRDQLLTIGIRPTFPATTYGYIKMTTKEIEKGIHSVEKFVEKPDLEKATVYARSWEYLWNLGIFAADSNYFMSLYEKHLPRSFSHLTTIGKAIGKESYKRTLKKEYIQMTKISIDYGIIEKTKKIAVIPADNLGWTDVGTWSELKKVLDDTDEHHNHTQGRVFLKNSENNLVMGHGKRVIGAKGIKDMIIIDTEDALLILPRRESANVKEILEEIKAQGMNEYL